METYRKETKCIKCGYVETLDKWEEYYLPTMKINGDYISRKCSNCGYIWIENPLDFKGE